MGGYVYCYNNPIIVIDPDGRKGYVIDGEGIIAPVNDEGVDENGKNTFDVLYRKETYSEENRKDYDGTGNKNGLKVTDTNILKQLSQRSGFQSDNEDIYFSKTANGRDAFAVFMFVANGEREEWTLDGYSKKGVNEFILATTRSYDHGVTTDGGKGVSKFGYQLKDQIFCLHSHGKSTVNASGGDKNVYSRKYWDLNNDKEGGYYPAPHYLYVASHKTLLQFNSWENKISPQIVSNGKDLQNTIMKK